MFCKGDFFNDSDKNFWELFLCPLDSLVVSFFFLCLQEEINDLLLPLCCSESTFWVCCSILSFTCGSHTEKIVNGVTSSISAVSRVNFYGNQIFRNWTCLSLSLGWSENSETNSLGTAWQKNKCLRVGKTQQSPIKLSQEARKRHLPASHSMEIRLFLPWLKWWEVL